MHATNTLELLIRRANRIGEFFAAMPDRDQAQLDIADHIRKFWEPRMRRALLDWLDDAAPATAHEQLKDIVRQAVQRHRDMLEPLSGDAPARA